MAAGVAVYAVLALGITWPLVLDPASTVVTPRWGELSHSLWIQWWFERAVESSEAKLFETDVIQFPSTLNLQLADINLAVNGPSYLLGKVVGRVGAYNGMILLSFVLSASLMWWLARDLSGDVGSGWMAGVFYAASSYWIACALNAWIYLVQIWLLPLVLLAIRRAVRHRRLGDAALAGLSLGLAFHVTPYYFLYLLALLAMLAGWWAGRGFLPGRDGLAALGVGAATTALVVLPRAAAMALAASRREHFVHHGPLNTLLSARPGEFFLPSAEVVAARVPEVGYLAVFLGYTLIGVVVAGLWASRRRAEQLPWLIFAAFLAILSLGPFATPGGVQIPLPGYLIQHLPGFSGTTNHWRWSLPAIFCLILAASIGMSELRRRLGRPGALLLPALLALHLLEVGWVHPFPRVKPAWAPRPTPAALLVQHLDDVEVVLDLSGCAQLNQIWHGKVLVGGVVPRIDADAIHASRRIWREFEARATLEEQIQYLGELGVDALILDSERVAVIRPDASPPASFRGRWLRAGASAPADSVPPTDALSPSRTTVRCGDFPDAPPGPAG
jgi:hypothetical protein